MTTPTVKCKVCEYEGGYHTEIWDNLCQDCGEKKHKCEFCDNEQVKFMGHDVGLCQKHISECLSLHYQFERR